MQMMCLKHQETDLQKQRVMIFFPSAYEQMKHFTFLLFLGKPQDSIQYAKSKDSLNVPLNDIFSSLDMLNRQIKILTL